MPIPRVKSINLRATSSATVLQIGTSTVPQPTWRPYSRTLESTTPFTMSGTICNANTGTATSRPRSMTPGAVRYSQTWSILSSISTAYMIWIGLWIQPTVYMKLSRNYPLKNLELSTRKGYISAVILKERLLLWQSTWTNLRCERPLTSLIVCNRLRFVTIRFFKITGLRYKHLFGSIRNSRTNIGSFITQAPLMEQYLLMEQRAGLRMPILLRHSPKDHGIQMATFLAILLSMVTSCLPQSTTLDTWHLSGRDQRWLGLSPSSSLSKWSTDQHSK